MHSLVVVLQNVLVQSAPTAQPLPFAHFVLQDPPQSRSVSFPSFSVSVHCAITHVFVTGLQRAPVQSAATAQAFPSAHFVEQEPPQSVSVSSPSFTVSAQ